MLITTSAEADRVLNLFAVLDWMPRLPPPQEHQVWQDSSGIEPSRPRQRTGGQPLARLLNDL